MIFLTTGETLYSVGPNDKVPINLQPYSETESSYEQTGSARKQQRLRFALWWFYSQTRLGKAAFWVEKKPRNINGNVIHLWSSEHKVRFSKRD